MIYDFTTKDMSDLLYDDLSEIKDNNESKTEAVLTMPTTESIFPCRVINTPIDRVLKSQNAVPLAKDFQITIEHWSDSQRTCMEMANNTDKVLQKRNLLRTNTQQIIFDTITKKYRLIISYEVRYNAITNSFEFIK